MKKSSFFVANRLYNETDIKDFIMNCDSSYHPEVYEAIKSYAQETEQYIKPFSEWVHEYDPDLYVVGSVTPGGYIKDKIEEDYYG